MAEGKQNFGTYHINTDIQNYELARSNFFTFIVDDLEGLVKSDFSLEQPEAGDIINNGQEVIKLSVTKASVPHFEVAPLEIRRGNSVIKFAGNPSFKEGSLELQDFVGLKVKSVLMAWQALSYDVVNDRGGRASAYKKNCTLIEYTQDYEEVRRWDLIGCWISGIQEDDFDMNSDGARKITATLQFDRAIMHDPIVS